MFCFNCGQKIDDEAKFCPYCGTRVVKTAESAYQSASETHTEEALPGSEDIAAEVPDAGFTAQEQTAEPTRESEPEPETASETEDVPEPYRAEEQNSVSDGTTVDRASSDDAASDDAAFGNAEELSFDVREQEPPESADTFVFEASNGTQSAEQKSADAPEAPVEDAASFVTPEPRYGAQESFGGGRYTAWNTYTESPERTSVATIPRPEPEPPQVAQPQTTQPQTNAEKSEKKAKPEKPAKVKKVKPLGRLGVGRGFLAVLLALLLLVSLLAAAASTVAAVSLTEDGLEHMVENADIKNIKIKDGGKSVTVSELIYDKYHESGDGQDRPDLTEDVIDSLLEDEVVSDLAAELLEEYRSYFVDGESGSGVSTKKIVDYIDRHRAEFGKALKDAGYENDVDALTDELSAVIGDIDIGDYSIKSLEEDHSALMNVVSLMLSKAFLIISWSLTAVWLILLICTAKRRVSAMFSFIGTPVLIVGLLFCIASVAGVLMPMFYDNALAAAAVNSLVYPVLLTGAAAVVLGIIFIMIGSSIKSHRKKAAAAAAAARRHYA